MSAAWIGIAGPTASGKTAAALHLAREHDLEIVSVDSALVYRGMDVGTAKPSEAERSRVAHHLIDIVDPVEHYSAAAFVTDARRLITAIRARGRLPLLVGGTMLYFKALIDGIDAMPAADPALRAELAAQARAEGWPALHARLAKVDPVTAGRLAPLDGQRIQRALEVWHASGRPLSSFHAKQGAPRRSADGDGLLISLEPERREWLHERIAIRFDAMLEAGFLDEVRALRARGDLNPDLPSMRCVGYRQAWAHLDASDGTGAGGSQGPGPGGPTWREQGIAATRQLARRQLTWLRGMHGRRVVPADASDAPALVAALVRRSVVAA
ncbi:MAG: tRNA (adenosine(37)-N6)-dimethylallyltransferase MiaA [Comamonadaceae bacterium]|nr:MAG: tRNA (adenosine(37)-N6)-dimethylallyltransferase MiaA [Comamonadaceae bacterium]